MADTPPAMTSTRLAATVVLSAAIIATHDALHRRNAHRMKLTLGMCQWVFVCAIIHATSPVTFMPMFCPFVHLARKPPAPDRPL